MLRFVVHDGSEGLSPDGWLTDRISVGGLTSVFTPELVGAAVDEAGVREQRRRRGPHVPVLVPGPRRPGHRDGLRRGLFPLTSQDPALDDYLRQGY